MAKRLSITCSSGHLPNGHTVMMGEIGFKESGQPAMFLWCKFHRKRHACTLDQMLQTFRAMTGESEQMKQQYIATLNKAILDVMDDGIIESKQESA